MQAIDGFVEKAVDEHVFCYNLGSSFNCPVCFAVPCFSVFTGSERPENTP